MNTCMQSLEGLFSTQMFHSSFSIVKQTPRYYSKELHTNNVTSVITHLFAKNNAAQFTSYSDHAAQQRSSTPAIATTVVPYLALSSEYRQEYGLFGNEDEGMVYDETTKEVKEQENILMFENMDLIVAIPVESEHRSNLKLAKRGLSCETRDLMFSIATGHTDVPLVEKMKEKRCSRFPPRSVIAGYGEQLPRDISERIWKEHFVVHPEITEHHQRLENSILVRLVEIANANYVNILGEPTFVDDIEVLMKEKIDPLSSSAQAYIRHLFEKDALIETLCKDIYHLNVTKPFVFDLNSKGLYILALNEDQQWQDYFLDYGYSNGITTIDDLHQFFSHVETKFYEKSGDNYSSVSPLKTANKKKTKKFI